jgi:hypothetical protein
MELQANETEGGHIMLEANPAGGQGVAASVDTGAANSAQPKPSQISAWAAVLLVLGIAVLMTLLVRRHHHLAVWLLSLAGVVMATLVAAHSVTGRFLGALIDERNVMSLSRFQLVAWTTIVLSAFAAAAWLRIFTGIENPLDIAIDPRLWLLMGISTASLVGSPLLLRDKKAQTADPAQLERTKMAVDAQGVKASEVTNQGRLYANRSNKSAAWSDLITGEEVSNAAHLDMSRLQMLFFTVVVLGTYVVALSQFFMSTPPAQMGTAFPSLHESMVALIGISHVGYLGAKATTKT